MANFIRQTMNTEDNFQTIRTVSKDNGYPQVFQVSGTQIVKQVIQSNERGPKGDPGKDGAIQYTAGPGIAISDENRISVTGGQVAVWGAIDGDLADQTDLKNVLDASYLSNLALNFYIGNYYKLNATHKNILTGATTNSSISLPNASATQTGFLKGTDFTTFSTVVNKLSYSKLTTNSTLSKTTSGFGTDTAIQLGIASSGVGTTQLADGAVTTAKIADGAVTSGKSNLTSSVDTVGWRKIQLSSNVNLYFARQSFSTTMDGDTWRATTVINKPVDLNLTNNCHGGAGGISSDHAINVCGNVNFTDGSVNIQTQNIYESSVTSTITWWAYIVEIIG